MMFVLSDYYRQCISVPFTKTKFVGLLMSFRPTRKAFRVICVVQSKYLDRASNKNAGAIAPQQQILWQQIGICSSLGNLANLACFFCCYSFPLALSISGIKFVLLLWREMNAVLIHVLNQVFKK